MTALYLGAVQSAEVGDLTSGAVSNVDRKHQELASIGVKFVNPPQRLFWGYGAELLDPDGYMISLWDQVTMRKAMRQKTKSPFSTPCYRSNFAAASLDKTLARQGVEVYLVRRGS